ncbi:MAG TPA: Fur family transcriptional regulator [Candidatus Brocadiia bacterium]|nr:Fur family transcriptional regulator [Candidatus Brocadiia bacterium]
MAARRPVAQDEAFAEVCRRHGMKVTPQRVEIYRELAASKEHLDAEEVYRRVRKRLPNVSLDTVYRTLNRLEEEGVIGRMEGPGGVMRFDPDTERHHHWMCVRCGAIKDFTCDESQAPRPPKEVLAWGKLLSWQMLARGVCAGCLKRGRS